MQRSSGEPVSVFLTTLYPPCTEVLSQKRKGGAMSQPNIKAMEP